jgi:hypothetical protein
MAIEIPAYQLDDLLAPPLWSGRLNPPSPPSHSPETSGVRAPPRKEHHSVLTLANAAVVLNHEPVAPPSLGYTRTMHHSSLIDPGDLWRPTPNEHPHVVRSIDHFGGQLTIVDEDGSIFHYPSDGIIPTAVADPGPVRPLPRSRTRQPRRQQRKGDDGN